MAYALSSRINPNRLFLTKRSEIDGRLDPHFYNPDFLKNVEKLEEIGCIKLGKACKSISSGTTPKSGGDAYCERDKGIPFVRSGDFLEDGEIDFDDVLHVKPEVHNGLMKGSKIAKGDLLIAIVGATIGKVGIYQNESDANINQAIAAARLKSEYEPEFVRSFFLTGVGQKVIDRIKRPVARANLNLEEVASLEIPNFSLSLQAQIIVAMNAGYAAKKSKEAEAQALLDSIDDYLLAELGIDLPEESSNTLKDRIFIRPASEISGGRFDAPIHQKQYSLFSNNFPMKRLKDCVYINPPTEHHGFAEETVATFVPMESISALYGEADIRKQRTLCESSGYTKFIEKDLLWAKITPCMENGKSAVVMGLENSIGFGSTEFHVFRPSSTTNINYIHALLRLSSLREYAVLYFSGSAGHQRVSDGFFKALEIPLPSLRKQQSIADHISAVRSKAKQLQEEAMAGLEQAKAEVEKMILGGG